MTYDEAIQMIAGSCLEVAEGAVGLRNNFVGGVSFEERMGDLRVRRQTGVLLVLDIVISVQGEEPLYK